MTFRVQKRHFSVSCFSTKLFDDFLNIKTDTKCHLYVRGDQKHDNFLTFNWTLRRPRVMVTCCQIICHRTILQLAKHRRI